MMQPMHFVDARAPQYATVTGVSGTLKEIQHPHRLSFRLTADHDKAQQYLVSAQREIESGAWIGLTMA
jgi:hypothetical protein